MPLHDVGYRPWRGTLQGSLAAVLVIAATGIRLAWTSRWLRRAVFFAWSPAILFAGSFFAFEQAVDEGRVGAMRLSASRGASVDGIGVLGGVIAEALGDRGATAGDGAEPSAEDRHGGPEAVTARTRHLVWARLLLAFMRSPQAILLAVVVGLVAPALVSRDLRAKAWLIYFTRPVGKIEYILGKLLILGVLVAAITMLPALALWGMGVAVSPSLTVALATWDLPLRIVAASLALAIPTVLMALAYSSLTAESRIASFAWFATWAACWIAHTSLTTADMLGERRAAAEAAARADSTGDRRTEEDDVPVAPRRSVGKSRRPTSPGGQIIEILDGGGRGRPLPDLREFRWLSRATGLDPTIDRWAWLSPYHALGVIQAWIFGIETRWRAILAPLASLVTVSLTSLAVLWWRVDAPARA